MTQFSKRCPDSKPGLASIRLPHFLQVQMQLWWIICAEPHSNDGAVDLQDQIVDGAPLYTHLASMLAPLAAARVGGGVSAGHCAGATWLMMKRWAAPPRAPFWWPDGAGAGAVMATSG